MTNKNFSRSGPAGSERKFGEAPLLGKVSRTPGSVVTNPDLSRRQMTRGNKVNISAVAWTLLVSFVVLLLLVVFLVSYFRKKGEDAIQAAAFGETAGGSAAEISSRVSIDLPAIDEVEALSIVRSAFATGDNNDLARHFTLGANTSTAEARAALADINAKEGEITTYRYMGQKYVNGMVLGEIATHRETGGVTSDRVAQLVICDDGKWRIDFDSYLRKSVPDWPEILSRKSKTSIVRVICAQDTYYNAIYSDDAQWKGYSLLSPDIKEPLYGYVRRGSPQETALHKILGPENRTISVTLEISAHPEADRRQFEITGILAEDWVIGGTRLDESF